jgi:hypothetical protein
MQAVDDALLGADVPQNIGPKRREYPAVTENATSEI